METCGSDSDKVLNNSLFLNAFIENNIDTFYICSLVAVYVCVCVYVSIELA